MIRFIRDPQPPYTQYKQGMVRDLGTTLNALFISSLDAVDHTEPNTVFPAAKELLLPGATRDDPRLQLNGAEVAQTRSLVSWGGKAQSGHAGMVAVNNGQLVARSLVPGPGIEILNPRGVGGDPTIHATPGRVLLGSLLGANLAVTTDQAIVIREWPQYIVTDIILTNASVDPVAASGGVYSTTGKAGRVLAANQSFAALDDDSVALPLTMGALRRLTGPAVYLSLTTANGVACTADVYVFGYWLMG